MCNVNKYSRFNNILAVAFFLLATFIFLLSYLFYFSHSKLPTFGNLVHDGLIAR